jgi:hypothetical protein
MKIILVVKKNLISAGNIIAKFTNPIILGFMYFFLITPISVIRKIFGSDELKIKKNKNITTFWKKNIKQYSSNDFTKQ